MDVSSFVVGLRLLAIPGLLVDLHDAWWENAFHVLAFGGVAAYAIYFGVTGRHKLPGIRRARLWG
jgi:hypothetical protein